MIYYVFSVYQIKQQKTVIELIARLIMVEPMNGYSQLVKWVEAVVLVNSQILNSFGFSVGLSAMPSELA